MKKVAVLLTALCFVPAAAGLRAQGKSTIVERVLVRVNGEILTQGELERLQIDALREKNRDVPNAKALQDDASLQSMLREVTPDLLVDAVDELLLVQRGRELNLRFTEEMFKSGLENVKRQNKLDDAQLKVAMEQAGMTMERLRSDFERAYLKQEVQRQEIGQRMNITEEESRQYYKAHPDQFMTPSTITLREIGFNVATQSVGGQPTASAASLEEAQDKLKAARERAVKGEDYTKLVTELSESATKANGGLIGPIHVENLNPALKELIDKLKPGDITEAIRTGAGFSIFKLESRSAPEVQPFDKVRQEISQRIYEDRLGGETKKLIERLRGQALIEWKDDSLKKLYEARRSTRAGAGAGV